ncbi:MAG: GlsB/YeaQ/YmgE family stress response membrane protein [Rubrivivax sp.]|nr:GlsB/YeaQ/YmgE family stress response membrane protein [Rubrivivax sp.]
MERGLLATLILGLLVGAIARFVVPGEQKLGWIMTCLLGVAGSFGAGLIGQMVGFYKMGEGAGWIASIAGAVVLLLVVGKLKGGGSGGSASG